MIDDLDKKIIGFIQGDLPLDLRPFAVMADKIGITEDECVERIRSLKEKGIIRRFGATLRHQEAGFSSNAMIAWLVPDDRVEEVGRTMADFREVTHCYQRRPEKDWNNRLPKRYLTSQRLLQAHSGHPTRGNAGENPPKMPRLIPA